MKKKIIENYEPFNDFWYKNCFMHGVAQVANHYGFIKELAMQDIHSYKYENQDGVPILKMVSSSNINLQNVFAKYGIDVKYIESKEKIIDDIKASIDENASVLLPVDCFYETIRKGAYGKVHMHHYLLIYGYDDKEKEFYILEHDYANSLKYQKKTLPYDVTRDCYFGYLEMFPDVHPDYLAFIPNNSKYEKEKVNETLKQRLLSVFDNYITSHKELVLFSRGFSEYIQNTKPEISQLETFFNMFAKIQQSIAMMQYCIDLEFEKNDSTGKMIEDIINDWNIVKGLTGKMWLSNHYQEKTINKVAETISILCDKNQKFVKILTEKCTRESV